MDISVSFYVEKERLEGDMDHHDLFPTVQQTIHDEGINAYYLFGSLISAATVDIDPEEYIAYLITRQGFAESWLFMEPAVIGSHKGRILSTKPQNLISLVQALRLDIASGSV